jgi:subtilase family serine protease
MKIFCKSLMVAVAATSFLTVGAMAQRVGNGNHAMAAPAGPHNWITPASSLARPEDAGHRAHTNWVFGSVNGQIAKAIKPSSGGIGDITLGTHYETPSSMACVYKIPSNGNKPGCVPSFASGTGGPQTGGWGAIALVDAYDNPYAASELAAFDSFWGLPAANFIQVYANGNGSCSGAPPADPGWGLEESLDIEWAHVMAPKATIILVEACSNSDSDLVYAEYVAGLWVEGYYGGGAVSNSWGSDEYVGENANDPYFGLYWPYNTTYFASAGDSGCGAAYPSSSPWLVSAGGTTVYRNTKNNAFFVEGCWSGSGGGVSSQETYSTSWTGGSNTGPWANYQYPIFGQGNRATPDLAFNADPNSGVVIYDCAYYSGTCYYFEVGGTSVSSPSLAGIVNNAGNKLGQIDVFQIGGYGYYTAEENNLLYSQLGSAKAYSTNFSDVTIGSNGCSVTKQWDYCTGVGSPRGLLGK